MFTGCKMANLMTIFGICIIPDLSLAFCALEGERGQEWSVSLMHQETAFLGTPFPFLCYDAFMESMGSQRAAAHAVHHNQEKENGT